MDIFVGLCQYPITPHSTNYYFPFLLSKGTVYVILLVLPNVLEHNVWLKYYFIFCFYFFELYKVFRLFYHFFHFFLPSGNTLHIFSFSRIIFFLYIVPLTVFLVTITVTCFFRLWQSKDREKNKKKIYFTTIFVKTVIQMLSILSNLLALFLFCV